MKIAPKKAFGQNFLHSQKYKNLILEAVSAPKAASYLEIGPGKASLTQGLANLQQSILLIEKDKRLKDFWQTYLTDKPQIKIIFDDFLKLKLDETIRSLSLNKPCVVVGNLPYNQSAPILLKLFKNSSHWDYLFLMFQKEVAQRITAKNNTKERSMISIWSEVFSDAKILFDIPPAAFWPKPKVNSSFVAFKIKKPLLPDAKQCEHFLEWVKFFFCHRRKTLRASLKQKKIDPHKNYSIDLNLRPENLSITEWLLFYKESGINFN